MNALVPILAVASKRDFFPETEVRRRAIDLYLPGGSMLCVTHIVAVTTNGQVTFPWTISSKSVLRGGPILHVSLIENRFARRFSGDACSRSD
jgi:hypothetical protein